MQIRCFINERPFFHTGIIGLLLIVLAIINMKVFPDDAPYMPKGFSTPIIYFEFIQSPVQVNDFFGITENGIPDEAFVNQMNKGNYVDFPFMLVYATFLFFFFRKLSKISGIKWLKTGMLLAILSFFADVFENIQLLGITANLNTDDFLTQLSLLKLFTWIKWFCLTVAFSLYAIWLFRNMRVLRVMAYVSVIPLFLGFVAFIKPGIFTELFANSVILAFCAAISFCFLFRNNSLQALK